MIMPEPRRIVDLSLEIFPGAPVFPGDPPCQFTTHDTIATTGYNLTRLCFGTHQGTHLDAPYHFFEAGGVIDQVDLRRCVGPASRIDLGTRGDGESITVADFLPYQAVIQPGARIVYRTGWDRFFPESRYFTDYPGLSLESAEWLADRKIALIGMDTPGPHPTLWSAVHQTILGAGILIVEGLAHLDQLPADDFFLAAAPLRLRGLDGSPVRALGIVG